MAGRLSALFILLSVPVVVLLVGSAQAAGLTPDVRCQPPKVKVKTAFAREKVSYDIEHQPGFVRAGKPLGWYRVRDRIGYEGKTAKGCVVELLVRIKVQPEIALRSGYKKKSGRCAGQIVLAHERRHGKVAKAEYTKLAELLKKAVRKLFAGVRVDSFDAVSAAIQAKLDGGTYARFLKSYDAAQDRFHARLKSARIVKKKCKLVNRR